jgi:hypothetical protein
VTALKTCPLHPRQIKYDGPTCPVCSIIAEVYPKQKSTVSSDTSTRGVEGINQAQRGPK